MCSRTLAVAAIVSWVVAACGGLTSSASGGGGSCVNVDVSTYDASCNQDLDCTIIPTGQLCSGQCACGGSAVNASERSRWQAATSSIAFGTCHCTSQQLPRCVNHTCTSCDGPNPPAGCAGSDGGACVNIDVTTFDRACTRDPDCIGITAGLICPGSCLCGGGAAISQSDLPRYEAAIAGIATEACPCPPPGSLHCILKVCTQCGGPGCPDGG